MNNAKIVRESTVSSYNNETGEVTQSTNETVVQFPKEPPFVKLYLDDINKLFDLPKPSSPLLFELLKKMDYEGEINLNPSNKQKICERTGMEPKTLSNYLTLLTKKGIFKRVCPGVYYPDPNLFGKGEWKDIYKRRKGWIKIEYSDKTDERVITSSLE